MSRTAKTLPLFVAVLIAGAVGGCGSPGPDITDVAVVATEADCSFSMMDDGAAQQAKFRPVLAAQSGNVRATVLSSDDEIAVCAKTIELGGESSGTARTGISPLGDTVLKIAIWETNGSSGHALGLADPNVTRVEVRLADGKTVRGVVRGGFWLAVWDRPARAEEVTAFDHADRTLGSAK